MTKTIFKAGGVGTSSAGSAACLALIGDVNANNSNDINMQNLFRSAGTLSKYRVHLASNSVNAPGVTFRIRKNAADGNLTVSFAAGVTGEAIDSTNTDTVTAGDKFNNRYVPGTTGTFQTVDTSVLFDATTATDTVSRMGLLATPYSTASASRFNIFHGVVSGSVTTESNAVQIKMKKAGTLKNLCYNITTNARSQASTAKIRINAADGITASITGSTTGFFEQTGSTTTVAVNDLCNFGVTLGTGTGNLVVTTHGVDFVSTADQWMLSSGRSGGLAHNANITTRWALYGDFFGFGNDTSPVTKIQQATVTLNTGIVHVSANANTQASTAVSRINGSTNGNISISITASTTGYFEDTSHTDSLTNATDTIHGFITTGNGSGAMTIRSVSFWATVPSTAGTQYNRSPSADSVTVSDSSTTRILTANRVPSAENPAISENLSRTTQAFRSPTADTITVSDSSLTRTRSTSRAPSSDSTTVIDASLTRILSSIRVPSADTTSVVESSLTRSKSALRIPSADSVTAQDSSTTAVKTMTRVPSSDSTTVTDASLTRILSKARAPAIDTVTPSESSLTRMLSASRSPSADSVTAQDSSTTKSITRVRGSGADSVTVVDISVTRLLQLLRSPSADAVNLAEDLSRIYSALRIPSADSITTGENVTGEKTTGAQVYERSPSADNITISESSLTRLLTAVRLPTTDTVSVVESALSRLLQLFRAPNTETVTTNDNATRSSTWVRATGADSISVADVSVSRLLSATRLPLTETITTGESLNRMLSLIRLPSVEVISTSENVSRIHTTAGQFNRAPTAETVTVSEPSLSRMLQFIRVPTADTVNLNEQLSRIRSLSRLPSSDSVVIVDSSLQRAVVRVRGPLPETPGVAEGSLTRVLSALRSISDTTVVSELQSQVSHARRLEETVAVTEPVIERIVTAIRAVTPEDVEIDEQVFYQALHMFVFDSVTVAEQLFSERQSLSGPVTYATPDEVRPLLGNIGGQRTNAQIEMAIDSAYDEINRRTGRQPPNEWKDTENDFGIVKKICRFKAALEMAVGIKDFEDREWMQKEIEEMFKIIEEGEGEGGAATSTDYVGSSEDSTYALNPGGIIWSIRYPNLKKGAKGENDTTINPNT